MIEQLHLPAAGLAPDVTADEAARAAIRSRLDDTLFVEAGAGSGKTSALVGRVVALVCSGTPLARIAAITFTERAAAELRDRIRASLEALAAADDAAGATVELTRRALQELDGAAIGTLHAFARRLLSDNPVQSGLPPSIDVLDEISSQVAFDQRWVELVNRLLDDADLEPVLLLAFAAGVTLPKLRDVAVAFGANWDLVASHVPATAPPLPDLPLRAWVHDVQGLCARADRCLDPTDRLLDRLGTYQQLADDLDAALDDAARLALLRDDALSWSHRTLGRKTSWPPGEIDDLRATIADLDERRVRMCEDVERACLVALAVELRRFTLDAADARRTDGRLEFHDLLVLARALLRSPEHGHDVRRASRVRYERILLDEFQDTDPIQVELACLLGAAPADGDAARPWFELDVDPGRLFFVGDPKQSIYRFRRADIALFLAARARFGEHGLSLSRNFRTAAPVIEWVNATFAKLLRPDPRSQPAYAPLDPTRPTAPVGPAVVLLGPEPHPDARLTADEVRAAEAADVVAAIRTALAEGWSVADAAAPGGWRPCRPGDISILLPARTSLPLLEQALGDGDVPYRAESSSLVYSTREVRDLLMAARAVDDPCDALAVVSALRSPVFGCGDDDLASYRLDHRGRWDYTRPLPDEIPDDHPVAAAMVTLRAWHDDRRWTSPSTLLERIVQERQLFEQAFAARRPRDVLRRLRTVVDQARAYGDSEGGTLRQYLPWVRALASDAARVAESVLPETDDDAVRIMTVHAAKGLEFPITVVSGMSTKAGGRRGGVQVRFTAEGSYALRVGPNVRSEEWDEVAPLDEQMDLDEKLRLLYVACTRARDHLVVSVHRKARTSDAADEALLTSAELLWRACGNEPSRWGPLEVTRPRRFEGPAPAAPVAEPPPFTTWAAARDAALARAARPRVTSATRLVRMARAAPVTVAATDLDTAELDPAFVVEPVLDDERPPWVKGRAGTAVGRAVHAVLQTVDLDRGDGVDALARAQATVEDVADQAPLVARLARAALGSPTVQRAARRPHWRETYVAAPLDGPDGPVLVEGFVDLLYRDDDGLVVVDFKTDVLRDRAAVDAAVEHYRLQAATYAVALGSVTEEPVAACRFVFVGPEGSLERTLPDLSAACDEVRAIVAELGSYDMEATLRP